MNSSGLRTERLTRRENDILNLLGQNLTDREIAERLVLSLNSVKWYARHIYGKLGVTNRREAVAKATELGLIAQGKPAGKPAHNLPRQVSSFIGREKEIEQVVKMIWEYPLVTLTGAGGVGKTRLAQVAAGELVDEFSDGVWYVELATVADPRLVAHSLADAVGIREEPGRPLLDTILFYFFDRQALLVLDNCEHLVQACAALVQALLTRLPRLKVIATSREPLKVNGEALFRVPSLTFSDNVQAQNIDVDSGFEAVRLFVERARAMLPDFQLTLANAAAVMQICRRLDGIPLAIELAAARIRLLSAQQIAERLNNAFRLLTDGNRTELPRHRTLRAMIDWSYNLLLEEERALLHVLSVFYGGWDLDAAEAISATGAVNRCHDVLDVLGRLVDKSLVQVSSGEVRRYHMLETIRQYAQEKLVVEGKAEQAYRAHLDYYLACVERTDGDTGGTVQIMRLEQELGNLRAALGWALENDAEAGLRFGLLIFNAFSRRYKPEFLVWLERLLAAEADEIIRSGNQPRELQRELARGRVLNVVGYNRTFYGQRDQAEKALLESIAIFEVIGEQAHDDWVGSLLGLGNLFIVSDPGRAIAYLETGRDSCKRRGGDAAVPPHLYTVLAAVYAFIGDFEQARQIYKESLRLSREKGNLFEQGMVLSFQGMVEFMHGNLRGAIELFQQSQASYTDCNEFEYVSWLIALQAWVELSQGSDEQVIHLCEELIALGQKTYVNSFFMQAQCFRAWVEWGQGAYEQAIQRGREAQTAFGSFYLSWMIGTLYILGRVSLSRGEIARAESYFLQVDDMADGPRFWWKAFSLHAFGMLAAAQTGERPDMAERAAILLGAQAKLFWWLPNMLSPKERSECERALAEVRKGLGEEAFTTAWGKGQAMTRGEVFDLVFELADTSADLLDQTRIPHSIRSAGRDSQSKSLTGF